MIVGRLSWLNSELPWFLGFVLPVYYGALHRGGWNSWDRSMGYGGIPGFERALLEKVLPPWNLQKPIAV